MAPFPCFFSRSALRIAEVSFHDGTGSASISSGEEVVEIDASEVNSEHEAMCVCMCVV